MPRDELRTIWWSAQYLWILFGYSLAFGCDKGGVIGDLDWIGLSGVGAEPHPTYGSTIPHLAFMLFPLMFTELIACAEAI